MGQTDTDVRTDGWARSVMRPILRSHNNAKLPTLTHGDTV